MAAAPKLLEACEAFVSLGVQWDSAGEWPELLAAYELASGAIREATNEK